MKLEIALSVLIIMMTVSAAYGQNEADNNINNVPNVTRYDEVGRPYDNRNDITVLGVDGIFYNKTDADDYHRISGFAVESETLRPICDSNYELQKEEINKIINDAIGKEIKCFNYDKNYVKFLEGTMYDLDINDWLEVIDTGCKWDSEEKEMICP